MADALGPLPALDGQAASAGLVAVHPAGFTLVALLVETPYKAGTVLTECGLDIGGLSESVDETHLAVQQRAGFHKVVYHLFSADFPVLVLVQFSKLAEVREVVPNCFKFIPGDVAIAVCVEVLEDRLHHLLYVALDDGRVSVGLNRHSPLVDHSGLGVRSRDGAGVLRWLARFPL